MSGTVENFPGAEPPGATPATKSVPARTAVGTNWTGAFVLYAKGMTLQEVADELDIDFKKLKNRARTEDWENMVKLNSQFALRAPSMTVTALSAEQLAKVEERIKANREDALKVAHGLRGHILRVLDAYATATIFLPVADIAKLATAARAIDESSMMALGDDPAPKVLPGDGAKEDPKIPAGKTTHVSYFMISPPSVATSPRIQKKIEGETTDVPVRSRPADAINAPRGRRVELEPEGSDTDDDPSVDTGLGRSSIDFEKLARTALEVAVPTGGGIPDFAKS